MPRANRHYLSGYVWHITHRCHKKEFLLKFARDKEVWVQWVFEAKKRYRLSVLNYMVTSNHIHLLVADDGDRETIPNSIQLIAGRTGQEFNQRKGRKGAFWEDRYHATAIERGDHLFRCLVYIDLNMVRAGVVNHPCEWHFCGYQEIQKPKQRYRIIDYPKLMASLGMEDLQRLQERCRGWVEETLNAGNHIREGKWSESIAVGSERFVMNTWDRLGIRAKGREIIGEAGSYELRESPAPYNGILGHENGGLSLQNAYFWNDNT